MYSLGNESSDISIVKKKKCPRRRPISQENIFLKNLTELAGAQVAIVHLPPFKSATDNLFNLFEHNF